MAIKNKDGSIYTLRGPNPIFEKQDTWNKDKITLLNMRWDGIVIEDFNKNKKPGKPLDGFNLSTDLDLEIADIPTEEPAPNLIKIPVKEVIVEAKPEPKKVDNKTATLLDQNKTMFHCLPIKKVEHKDELYDHKSYRMQFGQKHTFAGIIIEETDLQIMFWTDHELTEQSIVYPYNKSIRCWRIDNYETKSGGYVYLGYPSDISPDWTD